jgi:hypothetical protein
MDDRGYAKLANAVQGDAVQSSKVGPMPPNRLNSTGLETAGAGDKR